MILENLLGEVIRGVQRVKKIQVYAKEKGANVYLNSRTVELKNLITFLLCIYFWEDDSVQYQGSERWEALLDSVNLLVLGYFYSEWPFEQKFVMWTIPAWDRIPYRIWV